MEIFFKKKRVKCMYEGKKATATLSKSYTGGHLNSKQLVIVAIISYMGLDSLDPLCILLKTLL